MGGPGLVDDNVHFFAIDGCGIEREAEVGKLSHFDARLLGVSDDQRPAVVPRKEMDNRALRTACGLCHTSRFDPWLTGESRGRP